MMEIHIVPRTKHLRAVPEAIVFRDDFGEVTLNIIQYEAQLFMNMFIGVIKKHGMPAKGTAQFSVLLGEGLKWELFLDDIWANFRIYKDPNYLGNAAQLAVGEILLLSM